MLGETLKVSCKNFEDVFCQEGIVSDDGVINEKPNNYYALEKSIDKGFNYVSETLYTHFKNAYLTNPKGAHRVVKEYIKKLVNLSTIPSLKEKIEQSQVEIKKLEKQIEGYKALNLDVEGLQKKKQEHQNLIDGYEKQIQEYSLPEFFKSDGKTYMSLDEILNTFETSYRNCCDSYTKRANKNWLLAVHNKGGQFCREQGNLLGEVSKSDLWRGLDNNLAYELPFISKEFADS